MIKEIEEKLLKLELDENLKDIKIKELQDHYKNRLSFYDHVLLARHEKRPKAMDFINEIIDSPVFFKGDRLFAEDKSLIGGIGYLNNKPVTFLGTNKGKNLKENLEYNFGMLKPEGYRKSLRLMKQAEKFKRPIITFIDTPGAYPGIDAEERGQGEAIARNIMEMGYLKVPIIAVFTGEGGSGGALALSVANRIIMMEYSIFSILSPEGFATILWKDSSLYKKASAIMKLRAKDLLELGIIDKVIKEDLSFSLDSYKNNFRRLKTALIEDLNLLSNKTHEELVAERWEKYRKIGDY